MIELIDVSSLQVGTHPDWAKVAASGVRGVWFKASQYKGQKDSTFADGVKGARAAGLACGAYHFAYCGGDPRDQARFAYEAAGGLGEAPGELPPMLDWEYAKNDDLGNPISKSYSVIWAEDYMKQAKELWYPTGDRLPLIYTYPYFAAERQPSLGESRVLGDFPLVLAAYGNNMTVYIGTPRPPEPWDKVTVHQYIGNGGRVPGISVDCDRDRMDCSEEEFQAFLGKVPETFDHQDPTYFEACMRLTVEGDDGT